MEIRLVRIGEILEKIDETQPNMRAKVVNEYLPEMTTLENEVLKKDQEIKSVGANVKRAVDNAIDLPGLSHKLFSKYMNYIQSQVNITIKERPALVAQSLTSRGLSSEILEEPKSKLTQSELDTSADMLQEIGAGMIRASTADSKILTDKSLS